MHQVSNAEDDWIFGTVIDSEMARLVRNFDWSKTSLGALKDWHICMKSALSMCMTSNFAMVLWLGNEFLTVYNDAFRSYCGNKHPTYLGRPGSEYWHEIWHVIGPMIESVMHTGKATWMTDHLLISNRFGYSEETYWTYSYSPILSPERKVLGVFTATEDTTVRYLGERRLRTLRDLSANLTNVESTKQVIDVAGTTLAENIHDVPFCMFYLYSVKENQLVIAKEIGAQGVFPQQVSLGDSSTETFKDVMLDVIHQATPFTVATVPTSSAMTSLPPWNDVPRQMALLAMRGVSDATGDAAPIYGVLVVGLNTHRELDERYRDFLLLMASQVSTSLATARAYEEERRRVEQLAELDRAKTVFFSNVSHEFRTPLTLMIGPIEELLFNPDVGRGLTEAQKSSLSLVHRNMMRLLKLVNVLLDFSRIEAGRMQASYRAVNLSTLTAELSSVFRSACEKAKLRLLVNCPSSENLSEVYVDVDMWEKIVLNLLSNAFKYTLEGEIEVSIGVNLESKAAVLTVRDTGCGIPDAEMPRLFERFHRIQSSRGRTHEGSGIGLALVYELVRLHGGNIRAESHVNQGTKFVVQIPLGKDHLPADRIMVDANSPRSGGYVATKGAAASLSSEWWLFSAGDSPSGVATSLESSNSSLPSMSGNLILPATPTSSRERTKVMVVDDNVDMLNYVSRILLAADYIVVQAHDGQEALEMLPKSQVELVVSDIMMPRLDGIGLLKSIRESPELCRLPVMFLSARAGEEARVEGLAAGADDYIAKPFSAKELLARVSARIELSRQYYAATKREASLRREAEAANAIKDRFLAVLSHELRTPLAPALLLAEDYELNAQIPTTIREDMATIGRQIRLQVQLIDDLLDVTKLRQGKLQLRLQTVDVHILLRQTVTLFTKPISEKKLNLSLDLLAKQSLVVADATRLQQVFWNLLGNAIKFTPQDGSITVQTSSDIQGVVIRVKDTGIGIEPSALPRLFSAFEQIDREITRSFGGLGLGLAISKSIVSLHGGQLEATSEGKNRGATFIVVLPMSRGSTPLLPHALSMVDTKQVVNQKESLSILLVEDNATTIQVMLRLLGRLGHQVSTATSCQEAIQRQEQVDLLICDLGLPDGSGHELLPKLRARQPSIRAIALSGFGREEDVQKSFQAGFSLHLTKPVRLAQVEEAIAVVMKEK